MKAVEIRCTGRVQGVFFRASTQSLANKLNLCGWVRNEPDGSVRIVAVGSLDSLDKLIQWCHKGPMGAAVLDVLVKEIETEEVYDTFEVRRA